MSFIPLLNNGLGDYTEYHTEFRMKYGCMTPVKKMSVCMYNPCLARAVSWVLDDICPNSYQLLVPY